MSAAPFEHTPCFKEKVRRLEWCARFVTTTEPNTPDHCYLCLWCRFWFDVPVLHPCFSKVHVCPVVHTIFSVEHPGWERNFVESSWCFETQESKMHHTGWENFMIADLAVDIIHEICFQFFVTTFIKCLKCFSIWSYCGSNVGGAVALCIFLSSGALCLFEQLGK